jgi:hypothetical protein
MTNEIYKEKIEGRKIELLKRDRKERESKIE